MQDIVEINNEKTILNGFLNEKKIKNKKIKKNSTILYYVEQGIVHFVHCKLIGFLWFVICLSCDVMNTVSGPIV